MGRKDFGQSVLQLEFIIYLSNVDCEAIRALIALKLGRLLSFLSKNAFLQTNLHRGWGIISYLFSPYASHAVPSPFARPLTQSLTGRLARFESDTLSVSNMYLWINIVNKFLLHHKVNVRQWQIHRPTRNWTWDLPLTMDDQSSFLLYFYTITIEHFSLFKYVTHMIHSAVLLVCTFRDFWSYSQLIA